MKLKLHDYTYASRRHSGAGRSLNLEHYLATLRSDVAEFDRYLHMAMVFAIDDEANHFLEFTGPPPGLAIQYLRFIEYDIRTGCYVGEDGKLAWKTENLKSRSE